MTGLFVLKDPNDSLTLLSYQYHTLIYSIDVLKEKKEEFKTNPFFKRKLSNYIMLKKMSYNDDDFLSMNTTLTAREYLDRADNEDLKLYMKISEHIIAKELDANMLLSKVNFMNNYFYYIRNNLYSTDGTLNTESLQYTDNDREFLYRAAKKQGRIIERDTGIYNYNNLNQNYAMMN